MTSTMTGMTRRSILTRFVTSALSLALVAGVVAAVPGCSRLPGIPGIGSGGNAREPRGNYWVGRRYYTRNTRFWGYVRRPGESWDKARLAIFNENSKLQPDRLPETLTSQRGHGHDHNFEYRLVGDFSGNVIYDPNSDKFLPEFVLRDYELISENPAQLFPGHQYSPYKLPPSN